MGAILPPALNLYGMDATVKGTVSKIVYTEAGA